MWKSLRVLAVAGVAVLGLGACGQDVSSDEVTPSSETVVIGHRSGETEVPVNPQNVAVFDMAILESLIELGLQDRVVGIPQNSIVYLAREFRGADVANFGTLHEPNVEYMAGYDLDLIIISGRARPFFDELSELAPVVDLGLVNSDVETTFVSNQRALGQIFGVESELEDELNEVLGLFAEVQELSAQLGDRTALIIMYNEGNYQAFGPGGRFGVIHDLFGVPAVDAEVGFNDEGTQPNHGMIVTNEYIYDVNPDIIFVIDRNYVLDGANPENHVSGFGNEIVALTTAGQHGHIFDLNPEVWYIAPGGLQGMRLQVQGIIDALQEVLN